MVGRKTKTIIKHYPEDQYSSLFNQKTGLSIRKEDVGFGEPFWAKHGPELLDISITNYCTKECLICYRNSNSKGSFMSVEDLEIILKQAREMDVRQIALGGGNPNEHPDFVEILKIIREKYNIIPSYTTNGFGITTEIIHATKNYCGVVAISMHSSFDEISDHVNNFIINKVKTNIHFVITSESIIEAINILEGKTNIPNGINAIVFLNYKPVGINKNNDLKSCNSILIENFFNLIQENKLSYNIGFDSCFVSGINKYTNVNPLFYDFCEAGRFSAFIDEELNMVPCSFMIGDLSKVSINKESMLNIWQKSKIFKNFREKLKTNNCICDKFSDCYGGCPIYNINFCTKKK